MRICFSFLIILLLTAFSLQGSEHYFSLLAKQNLDESEGIIHAIWSNASESRKSLDEFICSFDMNDKEEVVLNLQSWMHEKISSTDTAVILYDTQNQTEAFLKGWNKDDIFGGKLRIENCRDFVLSNLRMNQYDWQKSLDSKMQYLIHSHETWQHRHDVNMSSEQVRNINFEQLRAYLFATEILELPDEPKIKYWVNQYDALTVLAHPGERLIDDSPVITMKHDEYGTIMMTASKSDGIPLDILENPDHSFTLFTLCTHEIEESSYLWKWPFDNVQSLTNAATHFFLDFEN